MRYLLLCFVPLPSRHLASNAPQWRRIFNSDINRCRKPDQRLNMTLRTISFPAAYTNLPSKYSPTGRDHRLFKSGPQTHPVKLSDILYLEKDSNYMTVHLKDKHILIRENMTSIFGLVPAAFIRVHKSYMVAIRHIGLIEVHQLTIGGEKIPIGDTYRDAVRIALGMRWCMDLIGAL